MSELTKEEVSRRCQDLVYKVAYSFYDSPYVILLRILIQHNVITEKKLSEMLNVGPNDVRKYLGMLHVHRLVKRYVNKEKATLTGYQQRQLANGATAGINKSRDVIYWYLDYREFSDVVKYRIAMMRRAIDEKIKNEVGKRGHMCPRCGKTYDLLEVAQTFDPQLEAFICEVCHTELVDDDPALHGQEEGGQDRMQRFNVATAPIRDALKSIEGARLPTINIVAWIAQNVTTDAIAETEGAEAAQRVDVVLGAANDAQAAQKLAEEQLEQNAIPVWYTNSTITGETTTLGRKMEAQATKAREAHAAGAAKTVEDEDEALAAHYANMDEEDEELEEAAMLDDTATAEETPVDTPGGDPNADVTIMVGGVAKKLIDVTQADEDEMTPEEYEKYAEALDA